MTYAAQQTLSDPARPRSELWRTLLGLALITGLSLVFALIWLLGQQWASRHVDLSFLHPAASPQGLIWTLSTFLCPTLALWIVMRRLHRRRVRSLIGSIALARHQFLRVMAVQAVVVALAMLLPTPGGADPVLHLSPLVWLRWLPLALAMLVVQIGIEELVFRGYLQSQLAARFRSPVVWLVVPAVIFALLHLDPSIGPNRWLVIGVTLAFALAAGDITARAGTLGPAIAMHLVNNFTSLFLVGAAGQMEGMALFIVPIDLSDPTIWPVFLLEAMLILITWLGARIVLRV